MSVRGTIRRRVNDALSLVRRRPGHGRILLYHEIGDRPDAVAAVPAALFRSHREWLMAYGLRPCGIDAMRREGSPAGVVALSFDDGHPSVVDACAALAEAGHSATVFVVPGWIDRGRPSVCGWSDLASLARAGIEIASHDLAHERPCRVPVGLLAERYRAAKARIEDRLGIAVGGFAYPYGLAPVNAREAVKLAGYAYAVTSEPGGNDERTGPFALRRNEIHGTDRHATSLIGKLAGTDDWFRPIRALENRIACG